MAFVADALQFQHERQRAIVFPRPLRRGEREAVLDQAQIETGSLGFGDGIGRGGHGKHMNAGGAASAKAKLQASAVHSLVSAATDFSGVHSLTLVATDLSGSTCLRS